LTVSGLVSGINFLFTVTAGFRFVGSTCLGPFITLKKSYSWNCHGNIVRHM